MITPESFRSQKTFREPRHYNLPFTEHNSKSRLILFEQFRMPGECCSLESNGRSEIIAAACRKIIDRDEMLLTVCF